MEQSNSTGVKPAFRDLFELMPVGVLVVRRDHRIEYLNPAFARLVGYEVQELIGTSMLRITASSEQRLDALIEELISRRRDYFEMESRYRRKDGSYVWGNPVRMLHPHPATTGEDPSILIFVVDITERRKMARQLRRAQKMHTLGILAGGMAHDFNNVLTIIESFAAMIEEDPGDRETCAQGAQQILAACNRGETLTDNLSRLGRPKASEPSEIFINEMVEELQATFAQILQPDIAFHLDLDERDPRVFSEEGRLHQVLTNLILNARDAIDGQGELTMETTQITTSHPSFPEVQAGDLGDENFARIRVCDTGRGISPELLPRIFEPFFTTKGDEGTGIGLSTVYDIVHEERGYVRVDSQVDRGSCFEIYLPALD